jgi:hypothetical protein
MIHERQYLKDNLYDWVEAVVRDSGRADPVIWRNENGVRPKPPFIALEIIGGSRLGHPWKSRVKIDPENPGDAGEQTVVQPVRKTLTMYGFGKDSVDLLEMIRDSIWMDAYVTMLARRNLVIEQAFGVTGLGAETDSVMETQAHFDFVVVYNRVFTDKPGWIEHAKAASDDLPMKPIET